MLIKKNDVNAEIIPASPKRTGKAYYVAGVDAGSTQTRVCLADAADVVLYSLSEPSPAEMDEAAKRLKKMFVIPSTFAVVNDEKEIIPHSPAFEDNMDSRLIRVHTASENPMFSSLRVIRGQKIHDASGVVPRYLDSATQKVDNTIFYVNILDALGYSILRRTAVEGVPEQVYVKMVISVRPKEMTSIARNKMADNLVGDFIFIWGDVKININIYGLEFTTEPEAQVTGHTAMLSLQTSPNEKDLKTYNKLIGSQSYMHIEGGGSSIGVEVIRDGAIIEKCSSTFPLGGNYLVRQVIDRVREQTGRTPSEASVQAAVATGLLRNGVNQEDISGVVDAAKDQVALDIVERVRHQVIDVTSDLTMNDMEFVSVAGRLFDEDAAGNSIAKHMEGYITQLSPHTELLHLDSNYIPQGNLIVGISSDDVRLEEDEGKPAGATSSVVPSYAPTVEKAESEAE